MASVAFNKRGRRSLANGAFVAFCYAGAFLAIVALVAILVSLVEKGIGGLNLAVFTQSTPAAGDTGGLANAIVGSLMLCGVGMLAAVIVGVLAGTWLAEYGREGRYASVVRFTNDVLLSAPSILVGLFIYELAVKPMHGFSGWAGSLALALIAAPVVARTTEDVLKLQSKQLRESGVALGAPLWITIRDIMWRAAGGGIITGALLAFARISGETAPLLFTCVSNNFFSWNMGGQMANLPVVIFNFALSAVDEWRRLAWVGALLIAAAVLGINILVRVLSQEPRRS